LGFHQRSHSQLTLKRKLQHRQLAMIIDWPAPRS
jgi:hypothetical protein